MSGSGLHLRHDFLGPSETTTQTASVSHTVVFAHHRRVYLYFTMGHSSPSKLPLPWGSGLPSNAWFLGHTRVLNTNDISIGSAVFAGLTTVTDRLIDSILSVIFIYFAVCTCYLS